MDRWLDELDRTPAFYFDSITQLRMDTWSRGRVTLVGDAGYCPGPAVGGSTSLAVVGAYVLAGELARAGGDHERAFPAYERAMAEHVRGSRAAALSAAKTLIPTSRLGVRGLVQGARLISALPAGPSRALLRLTSKTARVYNSMTVDDYPPSPTSPRGRGRPRGRLRGGVRGARRRLLDRQLQDVRGRLGCPGKNRRSAGRVTPDVKDQAELVSSYVEVSRIHWMGPVSDY